MKDTILVVEDDSDLIIIYKEILEMHEFNVETALDGIEGIKKFRIQTIPSNHRWRHANFRWMPSIQTNQRN